MIFLALFLEKGAIRIDLGNGKKRTQLFLISVVGEEDSLPCLVSLSY